MKVFPSILTYSASELHDQLSKLQPHFSRFQIDIADGKYVPNTTAQLRDILPVLAINAKPETQFDFHLMVEDYEAEIEQLKSAAKDIEIGVVFVHISLSPDLEKLRKMYPEFTFGIVFNPQDDVDTIMSKYGDFKIENIQIMTINPGFQGSPFIEDTLTKIDHLFSGNYGAKIYLDGGLNNTTIPLILKRKNKPDFLCPGSYFSRAENLEDRLKELHTMLDVRC